MTLEKAEAVHVKGGASGILAKPAEVKKKLKKRSTPLYESHVSIRHTPAYLKPI